MFLVRFLIVVITLACSSLSQLRGTYISIEPRLSLLSLRDLEINAAEGTLFEGGTIIRNSAGLHLFTTDKSQGVVNTSLVYYRAADLQHPFVFVSRLLCCSTAVMDGKDPRASLWAPMPSMDEESNTWHLFYVAYKSAPNNAPGWFLNFDGRIYHAISSVEGEAGIAGPYKDVGVVLQPDETSQPWEGSQGTDSISPPFRLTHGSAHTETSPPQPFRKPHAWWNGLVVTSKIGDAFERLLPSSLVNLNNGASENPVVTYLPIHNLYIAVFDYLSEEPKGFGLTWSLDGLVWAQSKMIPVDGGARTPLSATLEADGTLAVFYTLPSQPGLRMATFSFEVLPISAQADIAISV